MDFVKSFKDEMAANDIFTQEPILADGKLHRIHVTGDSIGSKNGWYVLHGDTIPSGAFGCWRRGVNKTWSSKPQELMTADERSIYLKHIKITQETVAIKK